MSSSKTPKGRAPVAAGPRRSSCPVSCCLDLLGDKWSLLVIRDLILGRTRFKEFVASPEGIPTNILSERLERLGQAEIIRQIPAEDGTKRMAYQLTEKGKALGPVILAMRDWGLRWQEGAETLLQPKPQ